MQMNELRIMPFKGIDGGDCFFELGKTQKQIIKQYGEASKILQNNILKMTTEYRSACELEYKNNKLVSIVCNKCTNPTLDGINIFDSENIIKLKEKYNFIEGKYYITFPSLGICIGGMSKKKIPEGKLAIIFSDSELSRFEFFAKD